MSIWLKMSFFKWLSDKVNPPKARIAFRIQKNEYCLGEEVRGEVEILSDEEFEATHMSFG